MFDTARVVIVDDEAANVRLLDRMLRSIGVGDVHGVTDPRTAVERCLEVDADLVLLDLHMPHRDGFDVLAELQRRTPADAFRPVLVLTADSTTEVRDRALELGAADFLTKPFDRMEVVLRARNLLQTRALHVDVQRRNRALSAELERREADERRHAEEHRRRRRRVEDVLLHRRFTPVFQPIADLTCGAVVAVEALTRVTAEPTRPPNEWFEEAAAVGLGRDLEIAAIAAAVAQLANLPSGVAMTLNASPETVVSPEFAAALRGLPGDRLVIEMTEHTRVQDYPALLSGLAELRQQGVRVAVDDAGAGYAGLQHVLALGPDLIKVDLELIRGIDGNAAKRALATALVTFARETGAIVIAEGIETAAELTTLRALGVPWGQGYHLARPAPLPLEATTLGALRS